MRLTKKDQLVKVNRNVSYDSFLLKTKNLIFIYLFILIIYSFMYLFIYLYIYLFIVFSIIASWWNLLNL